MRGGMTPVADELVTPIKVVSNPPKYRVPLGLSPSAAMVNYPPL